MAHAFSIPGASGIFSKDHETSRAFGRKLCDQVRHTFGNAGFFSTDELPRYGLTEEDLALSGQIRNHIPNELGLSPAVP